MPVPYHGRMNRPARLSALLFLLFLAACASAPLPPPAPDAAPATTAATALATAPATATAAHPLLLISLDGVNPQYLGRGDTPNLDRLAAEGVQAQWMNPSYPSLTFPNHYTVVTGLRPDHHGIVHNTMQDAELGRFWLANREAVGDGRWWGGEPIWVGAEKAGLATATLSWPGSEAAIQGVRPQRWLPFDAQRPIAARVDTVAGWLTGPEVTRPRLATLYFEHVDTAGHEHGPDSPQRHQALREVDAGVGALLDRLRQAGVLDRTDIVVVSDHGMAQVAEGQVVVIEDMVDPEWVDLVAGGQVVGFNPRAGHERQAEAALLGRHERYNCWRRQALPPRWHYGSHPRVPAIVCQMDTGWDALPRKYLDKRAPGTRGSHGFDPADPAMRAIFIARGPSFRAGTTIPAFDNVDVYPLLVHLLGIPAAPNDGDPQTLLPTLREAAPPGH